MCDNVRLAAAVSDEQRVLNVTPRAYSTGNPSPHRPRRAIVTPRRLLTASSHRVE